MSNIIGKTIITTGSTESSISLVTNLSLKGARVYTMPMIDVVSTEITNEIQQTISSIATYQWIIFTSKFGVTKFFDLLNAVTKSHILPSHIQIACVGKKTAEMLENYGHSATYICSKNNGKDFAHELIEILPKTEISILFPTGDLTQNMIELTVPTNITIHKIIVYNTTPPKSVNSNISDRILKNQYDFIIFTSPSGVTNFVDIFRTHIDIRDLKGISIGPTTSQRLLSFGITNILQAQEFNSDGIIETIMNSN